MQLVESPDSAWMLLRRPGLTTKERDRAAILAMAGDYRTSFDFLETLVFAPSMEAIPRQPSVPYRSWGTERIYVVEDSADFISLQHIMVMFFVDEKGRENGPMVMKHWRQDWRYQPVTLTEFHGQRRWSTRSTQEEERRAAWSQTVFHVDDTPRYASLGTWNHNSAFSAWTGNSAWRPLPRREESARDDYQVLTGVNRHTVQAGGWVHEQDNMKMVLDSRGQPDSTLPFRAREYGVNRYDRIRDFDFSAGDAYWKGTGKFWKSVREQWAQRLQAHTTIEISETCGGEPAFAGFFNTADSLAKASGAAKNLRESAASRLVDCVVKPVTDKED